MSSAHLKTLALAELIQWHPRLAALEATFDYPLGDDRFRIDHGCDYFAFFKRLGSPVPIVASFERDLIGAFTAVLRRIDDFEFWYLCDLKVTRRHAHRSTAPKLFEEWAKRFLAPDQPVFGVSMNQTPTSNRLAKLLRKWNGPIKFAEAPLVIFSLSYAQWQQAAPMLTATLGPITWFDPTGIKDIVLQSTGKPMPLLHAQHGPLAQPNCNESRAGSTHMFCLPADDRLVTELQTLGLTPNATATVLHNNCEGMKWRHLLTSDI